MKKFCKEHDIEISIHATGVPLIFIDVDADREELRVVIGRCKIIPDSVVYLVKYSDLGTGAKAKQIREQLEATGAKVIVPQRILEKRGPKTKHGLSADQIERYRPMYEGKTVTQQHIVNTILRDTGVTVTRHQLRTMFKSVGK